MNGLTASCMTEISSLVSYTGKPDQFLSEPKEYGLLQIARYSIIYDGGIKMGYRSQVTLSMYETDFAGMVTDAYKNNKNALDLIKYATMYIDNNKIVTLNWDSIKWYDGYDDVDFIVSFMRSGIQYSFKRVGEECGDVEEESNDEDWLLSEKSYIETYINIDAGEEKDVTQYIDSASQQEDEDDIEEVSECELLDIIGA